MVAKREAVSLALARKRELRGESRRPIAATHWLTKFKLSYWLENFPVLYLKNECECSSYEIIYEFELNKYMNLNYEI